MRARWCHGVVAVPAEDDGHPSLHGMAWQAVCMQASKQATMEEAKQGWRRLDETATPLLEVASVLQCQIVDPHWGTGHRVLDALALGDLTGRAAGPLQLVKCTGWGH